VEQSLTCWAKCSILACSFVCPTAASHVAHIASQFIARRLRRRRLRLRLRIAAATSSASTPRFVWPRLAADALLICFRSYPSSTTYAVGHYEQPPGGMHLLMINMSNYCASVLRGISLPARRPACVRFPAVRAPSRATRRTASMGVLPAAPG